MKLVAALTLTISYLPGVVRQGIWSDDYSSLIDPESHQVHASRDGRPIFGIFLQLVFGLARGVGDLWAIRLLALIGLLLTCNLVLKQLMSNIVDLRIFTSVIGAFSIASFQISVHWASAFIFTWVAYLSLVGYLLLVNQSWRRKLIGLIFLTICSLSYPIFVFFLIPVIFLVWYENDGSWRKLKTDSFWSFWGIFVSAILALVTNLILLRFRGLEFNDRVSIISFSDFFSQAIWFMTHPFVLTFRGYFISSPDLLQAFSGFLIGNLLIIAGIFLKLKNIKESLTTYIVLIIFTLVSLAPLFFPDQQQMDVRYVTVGSWLISYMLVSGAFLILGRITLGGHRINRSLVSLVFVIVFSLSISSRYFSTIQPIYNRTSTFISSELSSCGDQEILSGVYVLARKTEWPSKQNIGLFSQITDLASSWVPLNAVQIAVGEDPKLRGLNLPISWGNSSSSGCIIDLDNFKVTKKEG